MELSLEDTKKVEWRWHEGCKSFTDEVGEALDTITFQKKGRKMSTRRMLMDSWSAAARDIKREQSLNPRPAKQSKMFSPMCAGHEFFEDVKPHSGAYMSAAQKEQLCCPDRSISALDHPKWLQGKGVGTTFPQPQLSLMGRSHNDMRQRIEKQVGRLNADITAYGPNRGPQTSIERLAEATEERLRNGDGLPHFIPVIQYNKPISPMWFKSEKYLLEKEKLVAARPERVNHLRTHPFPIYTKSPGGLLNPFPPPMGSNTVPRRSMSVQDIMQNKNVMYMNGDRNKVTEGTAFN